MNSKADCLVQPLMSLNIEEPNKHWQGEYHICCPPSINILGMECGRKVWVMSQRKAEKKAMPICLPLPLQFRKSLKEEFGTFRFKVANGLCHS